MKQTIYENIKMRGSTLKNVMFLICFMLCAGVFAQNVNVNATGGTAFATYPTLKGAFDAINAGTHQGSILIDIAVSTTESAPAVLNSGDAAPASYTSITIYPSADGISISSATASGRGVIELNGADNVTIDGDNPSSGGTNRNLSITNTAVNTTTYTSVVRIAVATTVITSATGNTIKNCILTGSATGRNTGAATSTSGSEHTTYGVLAGGGASTVSNTTAPNAITSVTTTVGSGATLTSLTVLNNQIDACARGIAVMGSTVTVANLLNISNNVIGSATAGNTTTVYSRGITVQGFDNTTISGNLIQNMEWFVGTAQMAIGLGNESASGTNGIVEKNIINGVNNRATGTFGAYGINIAAGANNTVRNNIIQGITGDISGGAAFSTTFGIFGIRLAASTGHKVYNNSVNMYGLRTGTVTATSLLSACLTIVSTSITGCDIRNNIFSNTQTGGTSSLAYVALNLPSSATSALNLTLNNNAYYTGSTSGSQGICHIGTTYTAVPAGATTYAGLYATSSFNAGATTPTSGATANMRAYTSILSAAGTNDNASYASTSGAPFISSTNLHLDLASGELTNVEQKGDPSVAVSTDIDGDTRPNAGSTNPDMGADEVATATCSTADGGTISPASASVCAGSSYNMVATGATIGTGITYQWEISTTGGGVGFINVSGGSGATTTSYTSGTSLPAGTYYFRLKVTCSFGPITGYSLNELTLTVNPTPNAAATSNSPVCVGLPIHLDNTTNIGTIYSWTGPGGYTSSSDDPTIAAAAPGNAGVYTFTATLGTCSSTPATTTVVVNPNPSGVSASASPTSLCEGSPISLLSTYNQDFGYTMSAGSQTFIDISSTGTAVTGTVADDSEHDQALPFPFTFNGVVYNNIRIGNNGAILMGSPDGDINYTNRNLPAPIGSNNTDGLTGGLGTLGNIAICPWWDDFTPSTGVPAGTVKTQTVGSKFIVQWSAEDHFSATGTGTVTFQVQLEQTTNIIHFVYLDVNFSGTAAEDQAGSGTIGLNFSSSSSLQYSSYSKSIVDGQCITFTPNVPGFGWTGPNSYSNSTQNPTIAAATTAASGVYTVTVTNVGTGCSTQASTASVTVNAATTYYLDNDGDNYGQTGSTTSTCAGLPAGYAALPGDCDDTNNTINPGTAEVCANSVDDNCDGNVDEGCLTYTYYADADGDTFGDPATSVTTGSPTPPAGYVTDNSDCDDTQNLYADGDGDGVGAGAPAACGVTSNTDCNDADNTVSSPQTYYADSDGDTFGDLATTTVVCSSVAPGGYVSNSADCDDTQTLYADGDGDGVGAGPAAACGVTSNTDCNDADNTVSSPQTYYADTDGDTYGDASASGTNCSSTAPAGFSANSLDCDDSNGAIYPGATEVCNSVDDDCDTFIDEDVVTAVINAGGPTTFCKGDNVLLSASTGVNYTYQWKYGINNIPGATGSTYTATRSYTYSVVISVPGGCSATSNSITVTVNPKPAATATPQGSTDICPTGKVKIKANGSGATLSYQWSKNGVPISGATGVAYLATSVGTYEVRTMNSFGCTRFSNQVVVTSSCHMQQEATVSDMEIFPNPTESGFTVTLATGSGLDQTATVRVYNLVGDLVNTTEVWMSNGSINEHIELGQEIPGGVYLVKITEGGQDHIKQVMIVK